MDGHPRRREGQRHSVAFQCPLRGVKGLRREGWTGVTSKVGVDPCHPEHMVGGGGWRGWGYVEDGPPDPTRGPSPAHPTPNPALTAAHSLRCTRQTPSHQNTRLSSPSPQDTRVSCHAIPDRPIARLTAPSSPAPLLCGRGGEPGSGEGRGRRLPGQRLLSKGVTAGHARGRGLGARPGSPPPLVRHSRNPMFRTC